jgi:hypothetical protein
MMIVQPDFLDHWKTEMLVQLTGDKASPLLVLRLWAHCQKQRKGTFPHMTPQVLKAVCRWEGEPEALEKALTESRFIESDGSAITVHEWEEVNAGLFKSWENGKKGGRPKTQKKPTGYPRETDKTGEDETGQEREHPAHEESAAGGRGIPSLEAVNDHAAVIGLPATEAANFFDYYQQRAWHDRNGRPVCDWHAALRRWKVTAQEHAGGNGKPGGRERAPIRADYDNPNDPLTGGNGQTP